MSTLQLDIVTPDGKVYGEEVHMVNARTTDGEIGVLPRHMPLVAPLEVGIVQLKHDEGAEFAAVSGGFIEVTPDHVTILAEAAEMKDSIDVERATLAKERAENEIESLEEDHDEFPKVKADLERAINRIETTRRQN